MSDRPNSSAARPECSECGKYPKVLHRRYKGNTYCQACYQRIFKHRLCPECNEIARLPIHLPQAICRQCERKRPCVRCGVSGNKLGKFHERGPVCNKCYPYFIEPEKCSLCGKVSRKYRRVQLAGIVTTICFKCTPATDKGTCSCCHRYRTLTVDSVTGKSVCRRCKDEGLRQCELCHQLFPAGYGKVCEQCYWLGVLGQRTTITLHLFKTSLFKEHFTSFSKWLSGRRGPAVAAMAVNKYASFLQTIESEWGQIPSYAQLVKHFSVAKIRRHKRLFDWLLDTKLVAVDSELKKENAEQNQILQILRNAKVSPQMGQVIGSFLEKLMLQNQNGQLSLRTIRLYIRTATSLANHCAIKKHTLPTQSDIDSFLEAFPGHRASAYRFVTYLRAKTICCLWIGKPPKTVAKSKHEAKLKKRLLMCLSKLKRGVSHAKIDWKYWALQYFHGIDPKSSRKLVQSITGIVDGEGVLYIHMGKKLWIPNVYISIVA